MLLLLPSRGACPQEGGCCHYRMSGHLTFSRAFERRAELRAIPLPSLCLPMSQLVLGLPSHGHYSQQGLERRRESLGCHSQECEEQITLSPLKEDFGGRESRLDQIKDTGAYHLSPSHASTGLLGQLGPRRPTLRDLENGFTAAEKWRRRVPLLHP